MRNAFFVTFLTVAVMMLSCGGSERQTQSTSTPTTTSGQPAAGVTEIVSSTPIAASPTLSFVGLSTPGTTTPCKEWYFPTDLAVFSGSEFLPGTVPGDIGEFIPYEFSVSGFDLSSLDDAEFNERLTRPLAAFWSREGQSFTVFLNPDLRAGTYPIRLSLPTGEELEATIEHAQRGLPASPEYTFGDGVPSGAQMAIREAIDLASAYVEEHTGKRVAGLKVLVTTEQAQIVQKFSEVRKVSTELAQQIVGTRTVPLPMYKTLFWNPGGTWSQASTEDAISALVHEYFHVVQMDLIGGHFLDADPLLGGPKWLLEGAAVVFTDYVLVDAGGALAGNADFRRYTTYAQPATGGLELFETWDGLMNPPDGTGSTGGYARAMVAVDSLLKDHDLSVLLLFWQLQGQGMEWKSAFEMAFGETIDEFYAAN
jgi:hypothetical protein